MTMATESSVVLSVQQLIVEEEARQKAELIACEARLAQEREQQRLAQEDAARQAELLARQAREEEQRLQSMHQANLLKARLLAESEIALARQQSAAESSFAQANLEPMSRVTPSGGLQRMAIAGLATLLLGAVLCWALVIAPGQRRADQAYAQLRAQHEAVLDEAQRREAALRREQQQLKARLDELPRPMVPTVNSNTPPILRPPKPRPNWTPSNLSRRPVCNCLPTDPLCACSP